MESLPVLDLFQYLEMLDLDLRMQKKMTLNGQSQYHHHHYWIHGPEEDCPVRMKIITIMAFKITNAHSWKL